MKRRKGPPLGLPQPETLLPKFQCRNLACFLI